MKKKLSFLILVSCLFFFVLNAIPFPAGAQGYRYVASKFSIKYHHPNCRHARKIQVQTRVTFKTAKQALDAGYLPCTVCKPPAKESPRETVDDLVGDTTEEYIKYQLHSY
jgi:methylphosphotriester-DNA--protein-cysteine methyltransferase